ncbi:hypothetical protein RN001_001411 [Aquatica leii]|uniref:Antistasin-like domain-containing protein n=1 Tax=Aquatica leii TaxID=1421715 RepID=A0AAN7QAD2_9COLE|nr:hypothetical protein RN001_001411 [Aquatica leii]
MIHKLNCAIYFLLAIQCQTQDLNVSIACEVIKCDVSCSYGFVKDKNGCSTCQCFNPCCNYACPYGQQCEVESLLCIWQPCGYIRKCVPCLEPICIQSCPYGYQLDDKGCKTCECIDPCSFYKCSDDEYCVAEPIGCKYDASCGTRFNCVKKCPDILCTLYCPYGFELDCNNCPVCSCKNPCNNVICPKYHYCVVNQIYCKKAPCPEPFALCKRYCEDKNLLLKNDMPVVCNVNEKNSCGLNHTCKIIKELEVSFCCET